MKPAPLTSFAAVICSFLPAQSSTISPVQAAATEGSSRSSFPFKKSTPRRYQQIHSDLGTGIKLIKQLSFRLDETNSTFTGTRTLDLELQMGAAPDYASISTTYSANYIGVPTTVIKRAKINFGPQGKGSLPGPSPFKGMDLGLSTQYPHLGRTSLIWDAKVYRNTFRGSRGLADADQSSFNFGTTSTSGTGCVATGRLHPMTIGSDVADIGGTLGIGLGVANGPSNTPYWISLGTTDPHITAPGWCAKLHTNNLALFVAGTTDVWGSGDSFRDFALHVPNTFSGQTITCQGLAYDAGQSSAVKVALTQGKTILLPRPDTSKVVRVSRMLDLSGTTTAKRGLRWSLSTVGIGLVTRFSH